LKEALHVSITGGGAMAVTTGIHWLTDESTVLDAALQTQKPVLADFRNPN